MSIIIKMHVEDSVRNLLTFDVSLHQERDRSGFPCAPVRGGIFNLSFESDRDNFFFDKMTRGSMIHNVKIVIAPVSGMGPSRVIDLYDVYCVHCHDTFRDTGSLPAVTSIQLSPGITREGNVRFERPWKVSDPFSAPAAPIDINRLNEPEEEKKKSKKKCKIIFEAANSDRKEGLFGFDSYQNNYRRLCTSDVNALKAEYKPLEVEGEPYYPPWLSIRNGQTVTLDLDSKFSKKEEYKEVFIEPHPDFTVTPNDLKEAKAVQITCNNTNSSAAQLQVTADGKPAGALNVFYPEPKKVKLRWVFVEVNGTDEIDLKKKINKNKLEEYLKKAFNSALIDIEVVNNDTAVSDISDGYEYYKAKGWLVEKGKDTYIERKKISGFINMAKNADKGLSNKTVNLYFFNHRSAHTADIPTDGSFEMTGGISPTGKGSAYMVLDGSNQFTSGNIVHEVMHALGLPHSFSEKGGDEGKKHMFKQKKTDNYMDYFNNKKHTWKWQWEFLRQSGLVK